MITELKTGRLEGNDTFCIPVSLDSSYISHIIQQYRYNFTDKESAKNILDKEKIYIWEVFNQASLNRVGVVYITISTNDIPFFHAYKDEEALEKENLSPFERFGIALEASKLVLNKFSQYYKGSIWTAHITNNKTATLLCKRLGFDLGTEVPTEFGKFQLMIRRG